MGSADGLRQERAFFHATLGFLQRRKDEIAGDFLRQLAASERDGSVARIGDRAFLLVRHLAWDTAYFGCPTYRIEFADWTPDAGQPVAALAEAVTSFRDGQSQRRQPFYLFGEVPSEDLVLLQALGSAGLRLIETRLTYCREDLQGFDWPQRFPTREATIADVENLREVAAQSRNRYDRFHADPFFPPEVADGFLATFAESSVNGFADVVLVPAVGDDPPGAFLTGKRLGPEHRVAGVAVARIVLAAVSEARRGWHVRLMSEACHWFRDRGVDLLMMTTQSTNRAVIRNCERLGFRLGRTTHVLATHG